MKPRIVSKLILFNTAWRFSNWLIVIGFSLFTRNQQNVDVGVFVKFYVSHTLIVEDKKAKLTLVYFSSLAKLSLYGW